MLRVAVCFVAVLGLIGPRAGAAEDKPRAPFELLSGQSLPAPSSAHPIRLRFTSEVTESSPLTPIWRSGAEFLSRTSGGALEIQILHQASVNSFRNSFRALRVGNADLANCASLVHPATFSLSLVWYMPFIAREEAHINTRVGLEVAARFIRPEFERQDVYFGHQAVSPPVYLVSKRPVRRLEDLRGMKVGTIGMQHRIVRALGAVPVGIPLAEVYLALQRGVVEAILLPDTSVLAYNIPEVAKYRTKAPLGAVAIDHCMRRQTFDALPAAARQSLYAYQQVLAVAESSALAGGGVDIEAIYDAAGVETIELSPQERDHWRRRVQPVVDRWIAEAQARGRPVNELLDALPALYDRFDGMSFAETMNEVANNPVKGLVSGF